MGCFNLFSKFKWKPSMLKYILFQLFCLIIVIFATAQLFSATSVSESDDKLINKLSNTRAAKAAVSLILISFITYLSTLIGFCGVINKKPSILIMFCLLLLTLCIFEVLCAYSGIVYSSKLSVNIKKNFNQMFLTYNWANELNDLDKIQSNYRCCGWDNYTDWQNINNNRPEYITFNNYPLSCCQNNFNNTNSTDNNNYCQENQINRTSGCVHVLGGIIKNKKNKIIIMVAISLTLAVIQLFTIPIVWYFSKKIKENQLNKLHNKQQPTVRTYLISSHSESNL